MAFSIIIMIIRQKQTKFWFRLVTFIIITTFLYQDVLLAQKCLSPKSAFNDFTGFFDIKEVNLPAQVRLQIYLGFNKITEKVFPQIKEKDLFKEITNIFCHIDPEYEKHIKFKKTSIQTQSEDGNGFFTVDIDLIPANISLTVVFYDPSRPPIRYLKGVCKSWRKEDDKYVRERGFWIVSKRKILIPSIDIVKAPRHFVRLSRWSEYVDYHGKRILYIFWKGYIFNLWRVIPGIGNAFIMFFRMSFSKRFRKDYIAKVLKPVLVKSLDDYEINIEEVKRLMGMKKNKAVSSFIFLITLIIMNEFVTAPLVGALILALPIPIFVKIPFLLIAGGSIRAIGMLITKWFIYPELNISKAIIVTLPKWIGIPWSLGYIMRSYNYNFSGIIERDRLNRFRKLVDDIISRDILSDKKLVMLELSKYGSSAKCIRLLERMIENPGKHPERVSFYKRIIKLIKANSASLVIDFGAEKISSALIENDYGIKGQVLRFEVRKAYRMEDIETARIAIIEQLRQAIIHAIDSAENSGLIIDEIIITMEGLSSHKAGSIDYSSRFRILEGMGFREIVDDIVKKRGIQERRIYFINEGHAAVAGEKMFGQHKIGGLFYLGLNTSLRAARIDTRGKIFLIPEFGYLYNVDIGNLEMEINQLAGRRRLVDLASRLAKLPQNREEYLEFKERYNVKDSMGLSMLRQAFKSKHPFAVKVYEVAAQIVGHAIVMALIDGTIKDTDKIVIGGDLETYGLVNDELREIFRNNICQIVSKSHPDIVQSIVFSSLDNSRELRGAKYYVRTRIDKKPKIRTVSAIKGALKDIGPPMEIEIPEEIKQRWKEQAKGIQLKQYSNNISAKVIEVEDLPKGINAWHFRDVDGALVIVIRKRMDAFLDEIIYHEYREDYWMGQGLSQREAHTIASYEQVLLFSEDGMLTPYHRSQLENMAVEELKGLIDEYYYGRNYHDMLKERYFDSLTIKKLKEYELRLIIESNIIFERERRLILVQDETIGERDRFNPYVFREGDEVKYGDIVALNFVTLLQRLGIEEGTGDFISNLGSGANPIPSNGYRIVNIDNNFIPPYLKGDKRYLFYEGDFRERDFMERMFTTLGFGPEIPDRAKAVVLFNMWTYLRLYAGRDVRRPIDWEMYLVKCFTQIWEDMVDEDGYFVFYYNNPPESANKIETDLPVKEVKRIMLKYFSKEISKVHNFYNDNNDLIATAFQKKKTADAFHGRIKKMEDSVKRSNELNGELAKLRSKAQGVSDANVLQFAVPISVLRSAGDFTLALKKMGLLGKGDTIFELIIYDLENELNGDEFTKSLDLPKNIRVYGITKKQADGTKSVKRVIKELYPLRANGHLLIVTNFVDRDDADSIKDHLSENLEQDVSLRVIVRPDETSVISLSSILSSWLHNLGSSINIILPILISPREIKERLERDMKYLWEIMVSA